MPSLDAVAALREDLGSCDELGDVEANAEVGPVLGATWAAVMSWGTWRSMQGWAPCLVQHGESILGRGQGVRGGEGGQGLVGD